MRRECGGAEKHKSVRPTRLSPGRVCREGGRLHTLPQELQQEAGGRTRHGGITTVRAPGVSGPSPPPPLHADTEKPKVTDPDWPPGFQ